MAATSVANWTISSGAANLSAETTAPIKGSQSLKASGDFLMYQLLSTNTIKTGTINFIEFWVNGTSGATDLTGTLTFKIKDDSTTHATITVDLSTLTEDTDTKAAYVGFVLPKAVGENLRAEIELASLGGTSPSIFVDLFYLVSGVIVDGGRAVAITTGQTPHALGDTATGATTTADSGLIQTWLNEDQSFHFEHAGTAVYWSDT